MALTVIKPESIELLDSAAASALANGNPASGGGIRFIFDKPDLLPRKSGGFLPDPVTSNILITVRLDYLEKTTQNSLDDREIDFRLIIEWFENTNRTGINEKYEHKKIIGAQPIPPYHTCSSGSFAHGFGIGLVYGFVFNPFAGKTKKYCNVQLIEKSEFSFIPQVPRTFLFSEKDIFKILPGVIPAGKIGRIEINLVSVGPTQIDFALGYPAGEIPLYYYDEDFAGKIYGNSLNLCYIS